MIVILRATLLFVLSTAPLLANQQGVIVREARVYVEPSGSAAQVGTIEAGKQVAIFERKGGWKEIYSEPLDLVGWVRSYQVREGDYAPPVDADPLPAVDHVGAVGQHLAGMEAALAAGDALHEQARARPRSSRPGPT